MGAGQAKAARLRWPGIEKAAGKLIKALGNRPHMLTVDDVIGDTPVIRLPKADTWEFHLVPYHILTFPTKNNWRDDSDLALIQDSARRLVEITDIQGWKVVLLPQPGCGQGNLSWERQVRPLLEPIFDDRFSVISFK